MLGFDDYADIGARLRRDRSPASPHVPHVPRDRRTLLPMTPVDRPRRRAAIPGHAAVAPTCPRAGPASGPAPCAGAWTTARRRR